MTDSEPKLYILDSNLSIQGDLTISGKTYFVRTIEDLQKIDGISSITIPPISTSDEVTNTASSVVIDGDFIICEELNYNLSVSGSTETINCVNI